MGDAWRVKVNGVGVIQFLKEHHFFIDILSDMFICKNSFKKVFIGDFNETNKVIYRSTQ